MNVLSELYKSMKGGCKKYQKKPLIIEAFQYEDCVSDIPFIDINIPEKGKGYCIIQTLEGNMRCNTKDFIIRGIKGEYYCCNQEIFYETYSEIGDIK